VKSDSKRISVSVGFPRIVTSNGDPVSTGIFKQPVAGRVMLRTLNLDGDRQVDLSVHGGSSTGVVGWTRGHRVGVGWHGGHCGYCDCCRRGSQPASLANTPPV
jgi:hypothetical protein